MPTRILMASQLSDAVMDVARGILPPGYELIVARGEKPLWVVPELRG
jgi:hypothetical protein